jgi:phosphoglycolate phosphatase
MYDLVLFDLDGTLTDSAPGITRCVQYALAKLGIEENDLDKLRPFVGPPLVDSFKVRYRLNDQDAALARDYYRERFASVGLYENAVYPGVEALLDCLHQTGVTMAIATSKPTVYTVKILEHFGLSRYFAAVVGSNLDNTRVAKGEVIAAALEETGCRDRGKVVMVGDREHDVAGARENGIAVIAVGYGYGTPEELAAAGPDHTVPTVTALKALLCNLISAK